MSIRVKASLTELTDQSILLIFDGTPGGLDCTLDMPILMPVLVLAPDSTVLVVTRLWEKGDRFVSLY